MKRIALMIVLMLCMVSISHAQEITIQPIFIIKNVPASSTSSVYTQTPYHNLALCWYITGTTVNGTLEYKIGLDSPVSGGQISWTAATVVTAQTTSDTNIQCSPINYGQYVEVIYVANVGASNDVYITAVLMRQE